MVIADVADVSQRGHLARKMSHTIRPVFDGANLVSESGLVPTMRLAESAGLRGLLDLRLSFASANAAIKASSVVGGMLVGADSIDDLVLCV